MKILCIGDSLSLPGHGNKYEDTWFFLLKRALKKIEFISYFRRASTTRELINLGGDGSDCLEIYNPEVVILQLGVVDCAPRLIVPKSISYYLLKLIPYRLHKVYIALLKKVKIRKSKKVYVKKKNFQKNIESYLRRCITAKVRKVIIIGICYPDSRIIDKSPYFVKNVTEYNAIYIEMGKKYDFVKVIFPLNAAKHLKNIYDDGYHPNKYGNALVFKSLRKELKTIIS